MHADTSLTALKHGRAASWRARVRSPRARTTCKLCSESALERKLARRHPRSATLHVDTGTQPETGGGCTCLLGTAVAQRRRAAARGETVRDGCQSTRCGPSVHRCRGAVVQRGHFRLIEAVLIRADLPLALCVRAANMMRQSAPWTTGSSKILKLSVGAVEHEAYSWVKTQKWVN